MSYYKKAIFLLFGILMLQQALSQGVSNATNPNPNPTTPTSSDPSKVSTIKSFGAALSSIIVSELGDKTFFIAAIMAMRYTRLTVFAGAATALVLMTGISTAFGAVFTSLVSAKITLIIVTILFFFFGGKLLYDAYQMKESEEKKSGDPEEVEKEIQLLHMKLLEKSKKKGELTVGNEDTSEVDVEAVSATKKGSAQKGQSTISEAAIYWQALTLTFLGEWGDRSQLTTVALASQSSAFAVFLGASLGHAACTSLAVIGGKYLASKISEKTMNICGGLLFLAFGLHNLFFHQNKNEN